MIRSSAKRYSRIKLTLAISELVITLAFWVVVIGSGISSQIASFAYQATGISLFQFYIFIALLGIASFFLNFPLSFLSGYWLEKRFGLSNQRIGRWFVEQGKGMLIGICLAAIVLSGFYGLLWKFPHSWWLGVWLFLFGFSIVLNRLAPVVIFPLFYKFKPLENGRLLDNIQHFAKKWNLDIRGIFQFNLSKNTKKANAAFTGIGKSKRVILGDTLLEHFSEEEIETVFAHEVGHHVHRHLLKGVLFSGILTLTGLYIAFLIYQRVLEGLLYQPHQLEALPYLALIFFTYGLITGPLGHLFSRYHEYQADRFAVEATGKAQLYITTLQKLAKLNLVDETPHAVVEFLFHSHPAITKRIQKIAGAYP